MLLKLCVSNVGSIDTPVCIPFRASKSKHLRESNVASPEMTPGIRVLKSVAILGNNATGKSTILSAVDTIKRMQMVEATHNHLESTSRLRTSTHTLNFIVDRVQYQYGFSMHGCIVHNEHMLQFKSPSKSRGLFLREVDNLGRESLFFEDPLKKYRNRRISRPDRTSLLLPTLVTQYGCESLRPIYDYINSIRTFTNTAYDRSFQDTMKLWKDEHVKMQSVSLLRQLDVHITNVHIDEHAEIEYGHGMRVPVKDESTGIQKLFALVPRMVIALQSGLTMVVDDLCDHLSPHIAGVLIDKFHADNNNGAQLLFTTRNAHTLVPSRFRKDQCLTCRMERSTVLAPT